MHKELLLEIGTEEIPASYIPPALKAMEETLAKRLTDNRVSFGKVSTQGTPRRLVIAMERVAARQEDRQVEITGPPKAAAYDKNGKPTKAAKGFAKSQGVKVSDLQVVSTKKGEYVAVVRKEKGTETKGILPDIFSDLIKRVPFPKSMRWQDRAETFARPIHWIVALFGGQVVDFEFRSVRSGDKSRGHRFMAPKPFVVKSYKQYLSELERRKVIVDIKKRKTRIKQGVQRIAKRLGGRVLPDDDLLEEVNFLVEYPVPVAGNFPKKYLRMPKEVAITCMRSHQRYFSVIDDKGKLMAHFITVSNTKARKMKAVAAGNEYVVTARLEDAWFYYQIDRKTPLKEFVEELKGVVFHSKLGTSYEKLTRFKALAEYMAKEVAPKKLKETSRAAVLCKADLVSGVVSEFPDLQGVMGREYARLAKEKPAVAKAIYEHYLPIRAGGELPATVPGALVSIADKLDTVVGCFGVGLRPTGGADPYGLRRQAIGTINIIGEFGFRIDLAKLIARAATRLKPKFTEPMAQTKKDVMEFFLRRFEGVLTGMGIPAQVVAAVLATGADDLKDAESRALALAAFQKRKDFAELARAFKRADHITRKNPVKKKVSPRLFTQKEEKALHKSFTQVEKKVNAKLKKGDYEAALEDLAGLKEPVDAFFEGVLVMDKDKKVRENRLALLTAITGMFSGIADFTKL